MPYTPPQPGPPPGDPWLYTSTPVPTSRPAIPIRVAKYDPTAPTGSGRTVLNNLECLWVDQAIGIDPGRAGLRYRFGGNDPAAPQSIEQALSTAIVLPKTIGPDDEILITAIRPDGVEEALLYGIPVQFGMNLDAQVEDVHIIVVGKAKVLWNTPIPGAVIRDASSPTTGADIATDLVAQFNPKGEPNATVAGAEVNADATGASDQNYPTFMDVTVIRKPEVRRAWTLAMAARKLLYQDAQAPGSYKIKLPAGGDIDSLLIARQPKAGVSFDPTDASTYDSKDIIVSDLPITGRDWPSVLNELVRDKGFGMSFRTSLDPLTGKPNTTLDLFLLQIGPLKDVYLQPRGANFDATLNNIGAANLDRDINQVVNQWDVIGALERYEITIVLQAGFPMKATDGTDAAALAKYDKNSPTFAGNNDAYRMFVFDETGEGHYAPGTAGATRITTVTSMDAVLGAPGPPPGKTPAYATRRRKPIGKLITLDPSKKPMPVSVAISTDYTGPAPGIWTRTGTWQEVSGGFELLKDRLGIRITTTNPNGWKIGESASDTAPYRMGVVKVVESLCAPNSFNPKFFVRLTCVIEGDVSVRGTAERTQSSPLADTISRIIDARDRYHRTIVHVSSSVNATIPVATTTIRDDKDKAKAEATANRVATECGVLAGQIVIPRFTRFYKIGDRILQINGRNLRFRTDNGDISNINSAIYPIVIGVHHDLKDGQRTILRLSDQDGHRHRIESKARRHQT